MLSNRCAGLHGLVAIVVALAFSSGCVGRFNFGVDQIVELGGGDPAQSREGKKLPLGSNDIEIVAQPGAAMEIIDPDGRRTRGTVPHGSPALRYEGPLSLAHRGETVVIIDSDRRMTVFPSHAVQTVTVIDDKRGRNAGIAIGTTIGGILVTGLTAMLIVGVAWSAGGGWPTGKWAP